MKYLAGLACSVCAAVLQCSAVAAQADALSPDGPPPSAAWQEINPEPWIGFVEMTFYDSEGVSSIGFTSIRAPWNRLGSTFVYRDYYPPLHARTSISAVGVATAQAYLSQDRKASATRRAQSEVWGGDLLLISIPGAAPDQLTEVRFIVESKGVVSPAGGNAALWLCFGLRNGAQGACPDKLSRDGRDALHLPRGVNVVVPGQAKTTAGAGESWRHRQTVVMTMRGAEALVPFWYYLQAQTAGLDANGSRAQLLGMSIELPEGATCASRSRTAFGGACPKRKVPGG